MAASKTGNNDKGWWADSGVQSPPYLDPAPGQVGNDLDFYCASLKGYVSGQYPDGTTVPTPEYDGD